MDYYYNSRNLLVSEVRKSDNSTPERVIMYMYDSNGMLYAFKYNGDDFFHNNYYKFPWEITAVMFGGVSRDVHTGTAKG